MKCNAVLIYKYSFWDKIILYLLLFKLRTAPYSTPHPPHHTHTHTRTRRMHWWSASCRSIPTLPCRKHSCGLQLQSSVRHVTTHDYHMTMHSTTAQTSRSWLIPHWLLVSVSVYREWYVTLKPLCCPLVHLWPLTPGPPTVGWVPRVIVCTAGSVVSVVRPHGAPTIILWPYTLKKPQCKFIVKILTPSPHIHTHTTHTPHTHTHTPHTHTTHTVTEGGSPGCGHQPRCTHSYSHLICRQLGRGRRRRPCH